MLVLSPFARYCLREVVKHLRSLNIRVVIYVDHVILMASESQIVEHGDLVLDLLQSIGFCINPKKSSLGPIALASNILGML